MRFQDNAEEILDLNQMNLDLFEEKETFSLLEDSVCSKENLFEDLEDNEHRIQPKRLSNLFEDLEENDQARRLSSVLDHFCKGSPNTSPLNSSLKASPIRNTSGPPILDMKDLNYLNDAHTNVTGNQQKAYQCLIGSRWESTEEFNKDKFLINNTSKEIVLDKEPIKQILVKTSREIVSGDPILELKETETCAISFDSEILNSMNRISEKVTINNTFKMRNTDNVNTIPEIMESNNSAYISPQIMKSENSANITPKIMESNISTENITPKIMESVISSKNSTSKIMESAENITSKIMESAENITPNITSKIMESAENITPKIMESTISSKNITPKIMESAENITPKIMESNIDGKPLHSLRRMPSKLRSPSKSKSLFKTFIKTEEQDLSPKKDLHSSPQKSIEKYSHSQKSMEELKHSSPVISKGFCQSANSSPQKEPTNTLKRTSSINSKLPVLTNSNQNGSIGLLRSRTIVSKNLQSEKSSLLRKPSMIVKKEEQVQKGLI